MGSTGYGGSESQLCQNTLQNTRKEMSVREMEKKGREDLYLRGKSGRGKGRRVHTCLLRCGRRRAEWYHLLHNQRRESAYVIVRIIKRMFL